MATVEAKIYRTSVLDDIRVLVCFFSGGLISGFTFAWFISRPSLRQFWYIKGDKFLIPRYTYWTAFGLILLLGLVTPFIIAHSRRWISADLGSRSRLLVSVLIIGGSAPTSYFLTPIMIGLTWDPVVAPLAFLAFVSVALSVATQTLRLVPIVFVWNGVFGAAGVAIIYAVQFVHPTSDWYDFVQWPILNSTLAVSLGSWIIWRERFVGERTAEQLVGPERR